MLPDLRVALRRFGAGQRLAHLDRSSIKAQLRRFKITAVTNDHIQQRFILTFAGDPIRIADKLLTAAAAR
jgi:hypothetical protein